MKKQIAIDKELLIQTFEYLIGSQEFEKWLLIRGEKQNDSSIVRYALVKLIAERKKHDEFIGFLRTYLENNPIPKDIDKRVDYFMDIKLKFLKRCME